jgi:hypothetical protein
MGVVRCCKEIALKDVLEPYYIVRTNISLHDLWLSLRSRRELWCCGLSRSHGYLPPLKMWPISCPETSVHQFDVHVTAHRVKFLTIKPTRCTNFSNLFFEWKSTCFGQFLCFFTVHTGMVCLTGLLTACEQDQDGTAFRPDPIRHIPVFLNRRAAARYRALASVIPGNERFSWNLSF